jgi:hypothetical protein
MRELDYKTLEQAGACKSQLDLFNRLYGDSVIVTEEAAADVASLFEWTWAAENLLSFNAYEYFLGLKEEAWRKEETANNKAYQNFKAATKRAEKRYMAANQKAWKEHCFTMKQALLKYKHDVSSEMPGALESYETWKNLSESAYESARKAALKKYEDARRPCLEAYNNAKNAAFEECNVEIARAWARAYISDI